MEGHLPLFGQAVCARGQPAQVQQAPGQPRRQPMQQIGDRKENQDQQDAASQGEISKVVTR